MSRTSSADIEKAIAPTGTGPEVYICEDASTRTPDSIEVDQSNHLGVDEPQSALGSTTKQDSACIEPKWQRLATINSEGLSTAASGACDSKATAADDARALHEASSLQRTRQRLPALLFTFAIEMVVGFVISRFTDTFKRYPLLISFQPIISAISGNFGLQASTTNTRALAVGLVSTEPREMLSSIGREVSTGAFAGVALALVAGVTAFFWYSPLASSNGHTWAGAWAFAAAICIGQFVSIMSAALTGSAAPLLSKRFGFDPASTAGPLETAFQDMVGGTALLALSAFILTAFGDYAGQCPGGSLAGCIDTCRDLGGFNVTAEQWSCVHSCAAMVDEGIC